MMTQEFVNHQAIGFVDINSVAGAISHFHIWQRNVFTTRNLHRIADDQAIVGEVPLLESLPAIASPYQWYGGVLPLG